MQPRPQGINKKRLWQIAACVGLIALLIWARAWIWQALLQLFFGVLVALAGMPIMRRLEKKLSVGMAASLTMFSLSAILLGALLLVAPFVVQQAQQLVAALPNLYRYVLELSQRAEQGLVQAGLTVDSALRSQLIERGQNLLSQALPAAMSRASGALEGLGKLLLAPVFAFYFLRDRKRIGGWLLLWFPVGWRDTVILALREMRRETAGFIRGQLLVSAVVGALTAVGLLLCGIPSWLLLGTLMGILELIPYVGPFLGGALVLLFALQEGFSRTLWAMGVVLLVQQLEGGMLSPHLMSEATRLHPIAVLLCVMLGGMAGGMLGILISVPLLLCARAAFRVVSLRLMSGDKVAQRSPKGN